MDDAQKHFIVRYLIARARFRRGRGSPSLTDLEHELAHGYELLAGGILVHPDATPPIIADDQDPDFFRVLIESDDGGLPGTDPLELAAWRGYVLNDGPVPPQPDPNPCGSGSSR
jgi:hypothetical protein